MSEVIEILYTEGTIGVLEKLSKEEREAFLNETDLLVYHSYRFLLKKKLQSINRVTGLVYRERFFKVDFDVWDDCRAVVNYIIEFSSPDEAFDHFHELEKNKEWMKLPDEELEELKKPAK